MSLARKCCCLALDARTCYRRRYNIGIDDAFACEDAEDCECQWTNVLMQRCEDSWVFEIEGYDWSDMRQSRKPGAVSRLCRHHSIGIRSSDDLAGVTILRRE